MGRRGQPSKEEMRKSKLRRELAWLEAASKRGFRYCSESEVRERSIWILWMLQRDEIIRFLKDEKGLADKKARTTADVFIDSMAFAQIPPGAQEIHP